MDIPGISADDGLSSLAGANPFGTQELDRDAFMRLLVTQLEHQDPLEPVQNEEFVAQLATFSSLEQLESLNGNVVAMIALNQFTVQNAKISVPSAARRGPTSARKSKIQHSIALNPATAMLKKFMLSAVPHHHTNGTSKIAGVGANGECTLPSTRIQSW